jgi:hypothetical protein
MCQLKHFLEVFNKFLVWLYSSVIQYCTLCATKLKRLKFLSAKPEVM